MAIIEFTVGRSKYKIECPENEQAKLLHLADRLSERVKKSLAHFQNIDERTLLIITALTLEDELESKSHIVHDLSSNNAAESAPLERIDDSDMLVELAENLENVADYVEKLAKKIENY